jgi:hypothetical protein
MTPTDYILCVSITRKVSDTESAGEWLYYGPGTEAECEAAKAKVEAGERAEGETLVATVLPLSPLAEVA